jgi:hypothetical protein
MAAQALPLPGSQPDDQPQAGQGTAAPAPPTADKGNAAMLDAARNIVTSARVIGMRVPAALEDVRDILRAVQNIQQKIVQQQGPAEPMAPPV